MQARLAAAAGSVAVFALGFVVGAYVFTDDDWRVLGEPGVLMVLALTVVLQMLVPAKRRPRPDPVDDSSRLIP